MKSINNDIISLQNDNFEKKAIEEKTKNFSELLQKIENIDGKKKKLWIEIYENAIIDREISFNMFGKLTCICESNSSEFAIHGKTISSYIERMSKANDQLIKLAELVSKAEEVQAKKLDPEDFYNKFN
jgi:hypothetical protein